MSRISAEPKQWLSEVARPTLADRKGRHRAIGDLFVELRAICAEDGYELQLPLREDRPNPFTDALDRRSAG
jgi:hypothetical protein